MPCEEMPVEDRFLLVVDIGDAQVGTIGKRDLGQQSTEVILQASHFRVCFVFIDWFG